MARLQERLGSGCRRQELSYECKATLFDQEVRMAENIDFQFPMKKACSQDIQVGSPLPCAEKTPPMR